MASPVWTTSAVAGSGAALRGREWKADDYARVLLRMKANPDVERDFASWSPEQATTLVLDCAMPEFRLAADSIPRITVGVIDSHRLCREALAQVLAGLCAEATVPAFSDVAGFLAAPRPDLDLLIYRVHGSEPPGLIDEELGQLSLANVRIPVIILSDNAEPLSIKRVRQVLQRDVRCVLSARTTTVSTMLAILPLVRAGAFVTSLHMMPQAERQVPQPSTAALTRRQAAVFEGLSRGHDNATIAAGMSISESAVASHVRNIMRALGATSRAEAVELARAHWRGSRERAGAVANSTNRKCVPA